MYICVCACVCFEKKKSPCFIVCGSTGASYKLRASPLSAASRAKLLSWAVTEAQCPWLPPGGRWYQSLLTLAAQQGDVAAVDWASSNEQIFQVPANKCKRRVLRLAKTLLSCPPPRSLSPLVFVPGFVFYIQKKKRESSSLLAFETPGSLSGKAVLIGAAKGGHMHIVDWVRSRARLDWDAPHLLRSNRHLTALLDSVCIAPLQAIQRWKDVAMSELRASSVILSAYSAKGGHVAFMAFLDQLHAFELSLRCCEFAAVSGQLGALEWLEERGANLMQKELCAAAARSGRDSRLSGRKARAAG